MEDAERRKEIREMKRCYIDVETTGLSAWKNGIIQIACIIEIDDEVKKSFDLNCNIFEGNLIDSKALEINNRTTEEIAEFQDAKEAYSLFVEMLGEYVDKFDKKDKFVFVAYNASFDMDFLRNWFKQAGDQYFGSWFWNPYIDVMTIAHHFIGDKRSSMLNFKLDTVAKALDIEINEDDLHDALYDTRLTRQIYRQILS